ncbi:MAG: ABC transporter permease subunit [Kiritimatiellae bacterium]|nr:ABC transporter permease subunit [Kiritimatiellia bacterium]
MRNFFTIWNKELAGCFLSPVAYVTMVLFLAASSGTFMMGVIRNENLAATLPSILFASIMVWLSVLITVISMRLFTEEKRSGTIEPLMTAPVTEAAVVLGKYAGAMSFMMIVTLPVLGCLYILAEMSPAITSVDHYSVLTGYGIVLLISSLCVAIGLLISLTTKNQIVAAICCFCIVWMVLLVGWFISNLPINAEEIAGYLAAENHMDNFCRGIVDTRPIVLYLSGTIFVLFVAVRTLESRRWR